MTVSGRFALIVLDGMGIGEAPDAYDYGDRGSNTLGNVADAVGGLDLPNLESLGLGCCRRIQGLQCTTPSAAYGVAIPKSKGKDSTTGHWELCGLVLDEPFPTYPGGFPGEIIDAFAQQTRRRVHANCASSGTAIIEEYGPQQQSDGGWIVYTSADSVFQVAAHEDVISRDELYRACEVARNDVLVGEHAVARVIARPFRGVPGAYERTRHRRDFSLVPPGPTLLDGLADAGIPRVGVGKVDDLFAGRSIASTHAATNAEAFALIAEALDSMEPGLLFANVIEFDQSWGHRNDVAGFHQGLEELDQVVNPLIDRLEDGDIMIFTADHGNDPTTPSTDHSREMVPLLVVGPGIRPQALGDRAFADVGATVAEFFGIERQQGASMLEAIRK